jgi:hypothetical protein
MVAVDVRVAVGRGVAVWVAVTVAVAALGTLSNNAIPSY